MKMKNIKGMKKVGRNVELHVTKNDNSPRFGSKVVPNKRKKINKFDFRTFAD